MKKTLKGLLLTAGILLALSSCATDNKEASASMPELSTEVSVNEACTENEVNIIYFNDFHGNVENSGKNIGMAKMLSYVYEQKQTLPNTFVMAGGDNYQGTAISNLSYGAPVSAMYNALDVAYCAVGNHEFDWGQDHMLQWQKDGDFTFLASNIVDEKTGNPVAWAKPYGFVKTGKYTIAFVGLAHPDTKTLSAASCTEGLSFVDPVEACQKWVNYLKEGKAKEGTPDAIIAITHIDSYQDYNTKEITGKAVDLSGVEGLDAVLSAHSHRPVAGTVNGMPMLQAYKYGRSLGKMTLSFSEDGTLTSVTPEVINVYKTQDNIVPDEKGEKTLASYRDDLSSVLDVKIGMAEQDLTHDADTPNVTKLGRWFTELTAKKYGVQVGLTNGGGLRCTIEAGDVTMGKAYEVMPFDNTAVTLKLPGKDLKKAIDHGIENPDIRDGQFYGLIAHYDPAAAFENRLTSLTLLDGTPIEDNEYYTVVINDFMFTGGDKYDFSNAIDVVETYEPLRDIIVEGFAAGPVVPEAVDYVIAD